MPATKKTTTRRRPAARKTATRAPATRAVATRAPARKRVIRKKKEDGWMDYVKEGVSMIPAIVKTVGALAGFGDYHVESNSLMSIGGDPPVIHNPPSKDTTGGFVVRHREYIQDIVATSAFTRIDLDINPGLPTTFPWLAQVGAAFEQYRLRGMVFEYKSMSSDAVLSSSASSALGTVVMATSYNVLTNPFIDKKSMENYEFANSEKPSCSFLHPIECKKSQTTAEPLYIRTPNTNLGSSDLRLYDMGQFSIATQGIQGTGGSVIGELWCTFDVELMKPKFTLDQFPVANELMDHYYADSAGMSTLSAVVPFGSISTPIAGNLGSSIVNGFSLNLPDTLLGRNIQMDVFYYNPTNASQAATPTAYLNVQSLSVGVVVNNILLPSFGGANTIRTIDNGAANVCSNKFCFTIADNAPLPITIAFQLSSTNWPGYTISNPVCDIMVYESFL